MISHSNADRAHNHGWRGIESFPFLADRQALCDAFFDNAHSLTKQKDADVKKREKERAADSKCAEVRPINYSTPPGATRVKRPWHVSKNRMPPKMSRKKSTQSKKSVLPTKHIRFTCAFEPHPRHGNARRCVVPQNRSETETNNRCEDHLPIWLTSRIARRAAIYPESFSCHVFVESIVERFEPLSARRSRTEFIHKERNEPRFAARWCRVRDERWLLDRFAGTSGRPCNQSRRRNRTTTSANGPNDCEQRANTAARKGAAV